MQHVIEEQDLDELFESDRVPVPRGWRTTATGEPMPDVVAITRAVREGH